nr:cytochrome c biogenesis protein ResB [Arthrobacter echini]
MKQDIAPGVKGTAGSKADVAVPALGFVGTLRWAWTQLTSMRTALFLLLLLAVAAVPGSLFPQRSANPAVVTQYIEEHPDTGPVLDWFQLFDVYSSVWFSAIYLLLFISLIGCVIPRARAHFRAARSTPPRTPKRLSRLPVHGTLEIPAAEVQDADLTPSSAAGQAAAVLKKRGYRVDVRGVGTDEASVGAERGLAKELGNLVFHISLIGVLVAVAIGGLFGYNGQKVIVEGDSFVNTLIGYDSFNPGSNFSDDQLEPYSIRLDSFDVRFDREQESHYGQPLDFTANLTTQDGPGAPEEQQVLKVNAPVTIGGTSVYLVGNGYAPIVTVRDGEGDIASQGPVVAVPSDGLYTSLIVIKAPDAQPDQLGFVGFFLPTAFVDEDGVSFSRDPDPFNPQLNLNSYYGDLGLDDGTPENVYVLDTENLTELNSRNNDDGGIVLAVGQTYDLPEGKGSITFDGLQRYIALDIHHDPAKAAAFVFATLALLGLGASLFIARRRLWVKTSRRDDGGIRVEYGLLARGEDHRLADEGLRVRKLLADRWSVPSGTGDNTEDNRVPEAVSSAGGTGQSQHNTKDN